jgi:hypothetical protein
VALASVTPASAAPLRIRRAKRRVTGSAVLSVMGPHWVFPEDGRRGAFLPAPAAAAARHRFAITWYADCQHTIFSAYAVIVPCTACFIRVRQCSGLLPICLVQGFPEVRAQIRLPQLRLSNDSQLSRAPAGEFAGRARSGAPAPALKPLPRLVFRKLRCYSFLLESDTADLNNFKSLRGRPAAEAARSEVIKRTGGSRTP